MITQIVKRVSAGLKKCC